MDIEEKLALIKSINSEKEFVDHSLSIIADEGKHVKEYMKMVEHIPPNALKYMLKNYFEARKQVLIHTAEELMKTERS